jgi:multiple sugar transport system permease protein
MTTTIMPGAARRARRPRGVRRTAVAWLFLAPFTLVFLLYTVIPAVAALTFSLTDLRGADLRHPLAVTFTGLENYLRLFQDQSFLRDIRNTGLFVAVGVPLRSR